MVGEMLYELMIFLNDVYFSEYLVIVNVRLFVECWVCSAWIVMSMINVV